MNNLIRKMTLALIGLTIFTTQIQAKDCYNAKTIDVKWISYKTMAKIGVGGNFSKTSLVLHEKNSKTIPDMLDGAIVNLNFLAIDAHLALKNKNIAQYFSSQLSTKNIHAEIISVNKTKINLKISLNNITKIVPLSYKIKGSHVVANGVIDALDFNLVPALNLINKNVAGHKNKGWNDISISFDMPYTKTCIK